MEHKYRISFKKGDSSFEIESTDLKWLKAKEKEFLKKLTTEHKQESQRQVVKATTHPLSQDLPLRSMSINEFYKKYIGDKQIKSRTTIAVFLVYYLQKLSKKDEIITGDVNDCFKKVSYPGWNKLNVTDILRRAMRQALLNYVNNRWSLTSTGEDFVLNTIAGKEK